MWILFAVYLIIPIFIAGIVLCFCKRYIYIGVGFVLFSVIANCMFHFFPLNPVGECKGGKLRVMTYNINSTGEYFSYKIDSLKGLGDFLDCVDADIICFQEYDRKNDDGMLASNIVAKYPYHSSLYNNVIGTYDPVYSKLPIRNFYLFSAPERIQIFGMEVLLNGKWIYLVNCHLTSNKYTVARDSMRTEDCWISGIPEYYRYLSAGYDRRAFESQIVADSIVAHSNIPMLVCGDFNDVSGSYALKTIQSAGDLQDAWWNGGCGFGWTYDAYHLKLRLDHVLYSKDFELVNVSVPHVKFSDHYPVVADFVFKK